MTFFRRSGLSERARRAVELAHRGQYRNGAGDRTGRKSRQEREDQ